MAVEILQLNPVPRCLISPCKSLLDCNVFNLIYFDWSRSFWIRRWARLIVHGFCSGFFYLNSTFICKAFTHYFSSFTWNLKPFGLSDSFQNKMKLRMLKSQNLMPSYYICVLNSQKPSEILCRQNREITSKAYSGRRGNFEPLCS